MNVLDVLLLSGVAIAIFFALRHMRRAQKSGCCGCCARCTGCATPTKTGGKHHD
ncbi:MAG: FeoB-associated Cys-rich membrane protein [Clostridia bacterium]|nr:FeoB-associated Cys-rich membrane protein [Clostridia bacterium]